MKSSSRLDSATFQLTPTRTRCDLIISAKGKTEKIASGLLNPFLAHLKTAKEQLAKGGYSIVLEPEPYSNSSWFTKGTVERFVRFVSTPEILERVYTIESEILQIEEAIVIQGHNDVDLVDENQRKPVERVEGTRSILDTNEEKAIVLYQPGVNLPEENGSTATEENSKVKLLKVLETRKTVLQKEQGMAFARAVAAGFHVDDMSSLMSFAECFGALRLMDAGVKYIELWKKKHETGQWLEIEPTDAIASRSDFSAMNVSGVMLTDTANKQNEYGEVWVESHNEMCADGSRKVNNNMGADEQMPMTNQPPTGHQEYFPGQYPPHLYPPWPIHSPQSSVPVFHPYPMQGMPYYQNYAGNNPYFQSPYQIAEDSGLSTDKKRGQRRHSMGSKDGNIDSETGEVHSSNIRGQDDLDMHYGTLEDREKKGHKSGKKKAGTVVIRNINFISSRKHDILGGEESISDEEDEETEINNSQTESKNSLKFSRTERNSENLSNRSGKFDQEGSNILGNEANERWQAFENFLLKDADEGSANKDMFTNENEGKPKRRLKKVGDDLLVFGGRDTDEIHEETIMDVNKFSGKFNRLPKSMKDELLISKKGSVYDSRLVDGRTDDQYIELESRRTGYKQTCHDDFIVNSNKESVIPSDPLAINGFDRRSKHLDRKSSNNISDSYIVSLNSSSFDQVGNGGINAIDMDSEFPSAVCGTYNMSGRVTSQLNYTPDELILMPERGMEESAGYDHAPEYEMQIQVGNNPTKESAAADVKKESSKLVRDRKLKTDADGSDKRKTGGPMRRGKPSKLSSLDEARLRAEKLRTYKADLQKMKREKEVEEIKRLEALKMERQKRISSRGTSAQPSMLSQHSKKHTPTKLSPSTLKGSKFTDSEPGSLSPLQRSTRKNNYIGSSASNIVSKSSRSNTERDATVNRLSKSVSSLPEPKKENGSFTNSNKASITRMRRLSEPKTSSTSNASAKSQALEPLSKQKRIDGSEKKKISAIIVNHDRSKAATLPELKIRTSIKPDTTLDGPVAKEMAQNVGFSTSEGAHIEIRNDTSHQSEGDDNPVIEKTVLILECGSKKPFVPKDRALDETLLTVADTEGIEHQSPDLPFPYEVALSNAEKETPKFSVSRASEKSYNAPYARVSSLEDPSTRMSDYGKAPPTNLELAAPDCGSKAHISNFGNIKLGKVPAFEKPDVKESSKGFKRLLKFGRKNNSSGKGEHNMESDNLSNHSSEADDSETNTAVSNEVHTLKNLISQEETAAASTSQKSSRSFSLLSPFRKSNEKKLVVL